MYGGEEREVKRYGSVLDMVDDLELDEEFRAEFRFSIYQKYGVVDCGWWLYDELSEMAGTLFSSLRFPTNTEIVTG